MTLELHSLLAAPPWQIYLLPNPISAGPAQRQQLSDFLGQLTLAVENTFSLRREVFVHSWKLHVEGTSELLHDNLSEWQPEMGLGVWPDREPPGLWTQERFMDASAAGIEGNEPDLPAYRLLRLNGSVPARRAAAQSLFGREALTQIFSGEEYTRLETQTRAVFLPTIHARVYLHERFYMPLLDTHSLAQVQTPEQLDRWLGHARVYLRESAEDRGWLLLSALPLGDLLSHVAEQAGITLKTRPA